jgi:GNAT superfamily N-acetyltransferase
LKKQRLRMRMDLERQDVGELWNYRRIAREDADALGRLMLQAYRGTVDYEGETLKEAILEMEETLDGKYGPLLQKCSFVMEKHRRLLSGSIVTLWRDFNSPLLVFSMTDPSCRKQGMAGFLIRKSIDSLMVRGYRELHLFATETNVPARRLYEKIGFEVCR